jgi:NADPH:quinone reductase
MAYEEMADPEPGGGEVRIAVRAVGTNPVDASNRADGTWAGIQLPWIPGYEVAGVVDRVGPGVKNLRPGSNVVSMTDFPREGGGYAEYAVVAERDAVLLDSTVSFVAAAATPLAGGTAWEVLQRLHLGAGDRLAVLGASGGVGSYLVQLAALRGVEVLAVGRRENHERLRGLGAVSCVDYADGDGPDELIGVCGARMDALASLVDGVSIDPWLKAVREHGRIAAIEPPDIDLGKVIDANLTLHGVLLSSTAVRTRALVELLATGDLLAPVAHVLPLTQAADAHSLLEHGHTGGKIVLSTGDRDD